MKTKYFLLSLIFLIRLSNNSLAQMSREWISSYHFASEDAKALAVDAAGNIYVTGGSSGDYATVKYNSAGFQQWAVRFNAPGNNSDAAVDIAADDSGNVYVTGASYLVSSNNDFVTIKYNSDGVQLWAMRLSGPGNGSDSPSSIAVDGAGNVYVTGFTYGGSASTQDYTTVKYNSAGVFQWSRVYNGTGSGTDYATSIAYDLSGNVYVTGYSKGSGTSDHDYVTIKYSSSGAEQWVRIYQGQGDAFDEAQAIAVDKFSNVYVTGRSDGGIATQYDFATIKYNSSGDSLWVVRYNGIESMFDFAKSVAVDSTGNVYVFGQSYSIVSNYDLATVKYNSSGVFLWDKIFNGPGNGVENPNAMALDKNGNVYVTGSSSFTGQNYNYATVKYDSSGNEKWSDTYNGTASGSDESFSIAADTKGNIYITGGSAGLGQAKDFVTIKYSQNPFAVITGFIEGFYNSSADKLVEDTLRLYLRNTISPFNIVDSSRSIIDSTGNIRFYLSNVLNAVNYYIVMKHRNSIETWSNVGYYFSAGVLVYNFSNTAGKAFGSNQTLLDSSPIRYGIYSGDINQDGFVNLTDVVAAYNGSSGFITGYVPADVNGDNIVDLTDVVITYNNSGNFVSLVRP